MNAKIGSVFFFHYLIGGILVFAVGLAFYEWRKKRKLVIDPSNGPRKRFSNADAEFIRATDPNRR